ncbi:MAG: hypothetical protein FVQ78_00840 [Solirubrobacterales bacterium]|nr:hypothetical protein [Solirubrobacterales bacterium]
MKSLGTVVSIYARIARTYAQWAPSLLLLAVIVFVPLGLINAIALDADIRSLSLGSGLELFAVVTAVLALAATSLVGEVFYSGAVAVSLTHGEEGKPPSLREISSRLAYGRLVAVDLLYSLLVAVGLVLLVAPGVALFVWLGLAVPVVEIERRGVRAAFARSWQLVRGRFWIVFWVLAPIELAGSGLGTLATLLTDSLLGGSLAAEWLAESVSNILLTPVYAVAAVLLTLDLIAEKDGSGPRLHSAPAGA